ncbi:hypothetical protein A2755_00180 [Candidatus Wolfebacteria bacterium RIFCSPHIGHO2_01_FULL_48_22]|uniref:Uncharacterized protein n=2 Tax=Candidatus Wolfeibacteriota TaxID=1752735 RepID=A0A1F8DSK7_9BACT|nr:MAG: hypothetical protein A2755_00180 [Candidatus Wolfebacteria bacterium RIFCSPHIGHO2_01_FULL_48_22]OGM93416.1 MAG: hypothetical protein A2935_04135 [Candidatus Wolfebacteria bacterium RIFCSPLOWO2_01_FULL_47_17b]
MLQILEIPCQKHLNEKYIRSIFDYIEEARDAGDWTAGNLACAHLVNLALNDKSEQPELWIEIATPDEWGDEDLISEEDRVFIKYRELKVCLRAAYLSPDATRRCYKRVGDRYTKWCGGNLLMEEQIKRATPSDRDRLRDKWRHLVGHEETEKARGMLLPR